VKSYVIPKLLCPSSVEVNPHVMVVGEQTLRWVQRFHLSTEKDICSRLELAKPWELSGRIYPRLSREKLQVITDWLAWAAFYDDLWCDEIEKGKRHLEQLAYAHKRTLAILKNKHSSGDDPLTQALLDILHRLLDSNPRLEISWFIRSFEQYFQATTWEVVSNVCGITPDRATYIKLRPFAGGGNVFLELRHLIEENNLPVSIRENVLIQQLELMANNHVLWSNDIFSYNKEIAHGARTNLVWILKQEAHLSTQEAATQVAKRCDAEAKAYLNLKELLPSLGIEIDNILDSYLAFLDAYIGGHLDWAYNVAHRYD
jgi:hypothetical protein